MYEYCCFSQVSVVEPPRHESSKFTQLVDTPGVDTPKADIQLEPARDGPGGVGAEPNSDCSKLSLSSSTFQLSTQTEVTDRCN